MRIQVTTLYHDNGNHETELSVHATTDEAKDYIYPDVMSSWANVFCLDGTECDVEGCEGVPADPSELNRDSAIDTYFNHRSSVGDYIDIVTHDIDIPLTTLLGDWVQRAQHELDLSYTQPPAPSTIMSLVEELLARDNEATP